MLSDVTPCLGPGRTPPRLSVVTGHWTPPDNLINKRASWPFCRLQLANVSTTRSGGLCYETAAHTWDTPKRGNGVEITEKESGTKGGMQKYEVRRKDGVFEMIDEARHPSHPSTPALLGAWLWAEEIRLRRSNLDPSWPLSGNSWASPTSRNFGTLLKEPCRGAAIGDSGFIGFSGFHGTHKPKWRSRVSEPFPRFRPNFTPSAA
jgi:hypothetical protein